PAGVVDDVWTDHTDVRPTIMALTGLSDDYQTDGRSVPRVFRHWALPEGLQTNAGAVRHLGTLYKQLTASFGSFGMDTLRASTRALASNDAGDGTYTSIENQIANLTAQRNDLMAHIRMALNLAEFHGVAITQPQARAWMNQARDLLRQAAE